MLAHFPLDLQQTAGIGGQDDLRPGRKDVLQFSVAQSAG
jgi:hypothetical protein